MTEESAIFWPHEVLYIESLLRITNAVSIEASCIERAIQELNKPNPKVNASQFLDPAQNMVVHIASLSRFLWPAPNNGENKKLHKKRGQILRKVLGVKDSSPLRNREVRNFIEHFDEKLDLFLQNTKTGTFKPSFVGLSHQVDKSCDHLFRAYFLDSKTFQVLNQQIQLLPLLEEVERINNLLEEFQKNGGRFPKAQS